MKITCESKDAFKPIYLGIVIESEEEAAQFYALFNHAHLMLISSALPAVEIREAIISGMGGREPLYEVAFHRLCEIIK